jgi:hypothetical protein
MIIKKEVLETLLDSRVGDDCSNWYLIEQGKWEDDGKYSYREVILQFDEDKAFYIYWESRSGSYFSDYYYAIEDEQDEIELAEVEKKEKVTYEWVTVKGE